MSYQSTAYLRRRSASIWLVIEAFARRLSPQGSVGCSRSQKARAVVTKKQRLSAVPTSRVLPSSGSMAFTSPSLLNARVVESEPRPGSAMRRARAEWEREQGFVGFTDAASGTDGGRLRTNIRD